jgi:hypothetical protein
MRGGFKAWPKGKVFPYPKRIHLIIGEPRNFATIVPGKESANSIAAKLEQAIKEMEAKHDSH